MNFPDSIVQNVIKQLKRELSDENRERLIQDITDLSLYQKCQLFCLAKDSDNFPSEAFSLEIEIWNKIYDVFRSEYSEKSL
ncbi:MAG: hypothetical protein ACW97X_08855, partial [Candidatus Hodarchaeales archaeon]